MRLGRGRRFFSGDVFVEGRRGCVGFCSRGGGNAGRGRFSGLERTRAVGGEFRSWGFVGYWRFRRFRIAKWFKI